MAEKTDIVVRILAEQQKFNKQLAMARRDMRKTQSSFASIGKSMSATLAGVFAVDKLVDFGRAVVETRSQFEKLETVLGVTLGSQSKAKEAFDNIKEFASKTPFSVLELSDAFVKLTNFGLKPSIDALTAYGDLASSTGKSFDQLAEAIIDATTGEFERLKEFGIRASKQGDKVAFTFKGITQQVDFTSTSIQKYIEGLGKLDGVQGGMIAQSKTLGGQISNLGDAWDSLLDAIGTGISPMLIDFIGDLKSVIETVTRYATAGANLQDAREARQILEDMNVESMTAKEIQAKLTRLAEEEGKIRDKIMSTEAEITTDKSDQVSLQNKALGLTADTTALTEEQKKAQQEIANILQPIESVTSDIKHKNKLITDSLAQNLILQQQLNNALDDQLFKEKQIYKAKKGEQLTEGLPKLNKKGAEIEGPGKPEVIIPTLDDDFTQKELEGIEALTAKIKAAWDNLGDDVKMSIKNAFDYQRDSLIDGFARVMSASKSQRKELLKQWKEQLQLEAKFYAIKAAIWGALAIAQVPGAAARAAGFATAAGTAGAGAGAVGLLARSARGAGGGQPRFGGSSGVNVQGEFKIKGRDLVYIFNEEQKRNGRVG